MKKNIFYYTKKAARKKNFKLFLLLLRNLNFFNKKRFFYFKKPLVKKYGKKIVVRSFINQYRLLKETYSNVSGAGLRKLLFAHRLNNMHYIKGFVLYLEQRVDVLIYRMCLGALTLGMIRQLLLHKFFKVNAQTVTKPGFLVNPGAVITSKVEKFFYFILESVFFKKKYYVFTQRKGRYFQQQYDKFIRLLSGKKLGPIKKKKSSIGLKKNKIFTGITCLQNRFIFFQTKKITNESFLICVRDQKDNRGYLTFLKEYTNKFKVIFYKVLKNGIFFKQRYAITSESKLLNFFTKFFSNLHFAEKKTFLLVLKAQVKRGYFNLLKNQLAFSNKSIKISFILEDFSFYNYWSKYNFSFISFTMAKSKVFFFFNCALNSFFNKVNSLFFFNRQVTLKLKTSSKIEKKSFFFNPFFLLLSKLCKNFLRKYFLIAVRYKLDGLFRKKKKIYGCSLSKWAFKKGKKKNKLKLPSILYSFYIKVIKKNIIGFFLKRLGFYKKKLFGKVNQKKIKNVMFKAKRKDGAFIKKLNKRKQIRSVTEAPYSLKKKKKFVDFSIKSKVNFNLGVSKQTENKKQIKNEWLTGEKSFFRTPPQNSNFLSWLMPENSGGAKNLVRGKQKFKFNTKDQVTTTFVKVDNKNNLGQIKKRIGKSMKKNDNKQLAFFSKRFFQSKNFRLELDEKKNRGKLVSEKNKLYSLNNKKEDTFFTTHKIKKKHYYSQEVIPQSFFSGQVNKNKLKSISKIEKPKNWFFKNSVETKDNIFKKQNKRFFYQKKKSFNSSAYLKKKIGFRVGDRSLKKKNMRQLGAPYWSYEYKKKKQLMLFLRHKFLQIGRKKKRFLFKFFKRKKKYYRFGLLPVSLSFLNYLRYMEVSFLLTNWVVYKRPLKKDIFTIRKFSMNKILNYYKI